MPSKPLTRVLLERSHHNQYYLLPSMMPLKSVNNLVSTSRGLYGVMRMVVFARVRGATLYGSMDPRTIPNP